MEIIPVLRYYTVSHKKVYNLYTHGSIATTFGKNVAEKVSNQNTLFSYLT